MRWLGIRNRSPPLSSEHERDCVPFIFRPLAFAEAVFARQYASGTLGFDPSGRPRLELSRARQNTGLRQPTSQGFRLELQKKSLAELLHCRKPFRCLSQRGTGDGKADILKLVGRKGSWLEPREAIQTSDLASLWTATRDIIPRAAGSRSESQTARSSVSACRCASEWFSLIYGAPL